jgi:hypothetical protein
MKKILFLLGLIVSRTILSQAFDDFSTSKEGFNSLWRGDTSAFNLLDSVLRLNAPKDQKQVVIYRSIPKSAHLSLEIDLSLGFSPSASNRLQLFLTADSLRQDGCYLEIGDTGSEDAIKLYQIVNGNNTLVTSGFKGAVSMGFEGLHLQFDVRDSFRLQTKTMEGEEIEELYLARLGELEVQYFSIVCNYTSTRFDKFSFDDFKLTAFDYVKIDSVVATPPDSLFFEVHDLLISEFLTDPTPQRMLPEAEFIELYNNSNRTIDLNGWRVVNGSSIVFLEEYLLPPHQTVLICDHNDVLKFESHTDIYSVASLFTLSNSGFTLRLMSPLNSLIHQVTYDYSVQYSPKKTGGWSYELKDTSQLCITASWGYSDHQKGGTIGGVEFVTKDLSVPFIQNYQRIDSFLIVQFDEAVWGNEYYSKELILKPHDDDFNYLVDVPTCNSSVLDSVIVIPEIYGTGKLVFNEVLFNAEEDCPEFVELYNDSGDFIKVDQLYFGYASSGDFADDLLEVPKGLIVPPHSFIIFCDDFLQLRKFYKVNKYCVSVEMKLPQLLNDEGVLFLLDANGETLTKAIYNDDDHNDFLEENKGVSLERVNYDSDIWTSGNYSKGKASVGYINYAFSASGGENIKLTTDYNHYSLTEGIPLVLSIELGDGDYWGDVALFTKEGVRVQELVTDYHFSSQAELELLNLKSITKVGVYIISCEFRHPEYGIVRRRIPLAIVE